MKRLLRQGIDRAYVAHTQDTQNPKGKIAIADSLKRGLLPRNAVACVVDELRHDVLHNRILRATLHCLASTAEIDLGFRHELRMLEKQLDDVSSIAIHAEHFARVQLHRNNAFYRFLLNVCELCFFALLPSERKGNIGLRIFLEMKSECEKCSKILSITFIASNNSTSRYRVNVSIGIRANAMRKLALLPEMVTDVGLNSPSRKIVIECKFTPDALKENWGKLSARSGHLYQLFAYLKHLERRGGAHKHCEGLLLYPRATHSVDFVFDTKGHTVRVVTLDLRAGWTDIKVQL